MLRKLLARLRPGHAPLTLLASADLYCPGYSAVTITARIGCVDLALYANPLPCPAPASLLLED